MPTGPRPWSCGQDTDNILLLWSAEKLHRGRRFSLQANALREHLSLRGYPHTGLRKAFNRALSRTRTSLLYGPPKTKRQDTVKLVTRFSGHHQQLHTILSQHWHLLSDNYILNKYVRNTPQMVFRRATFIRDCLTKSHYRPVAQSPPGPCGTFPCGQCPRCPWIRRDYDLQIAQWIDVFTPYTC